MEVFRWKILVSFRAKVGCLAGWNGDGRRRLRRSGRERRLLTNEASFDGR